MRRLPLAVLTGLALALPGAASADGHRPRATPPTDPAPPILPATEPLPIEPTPASLPAASAADLPPIYFPQPRYRLLREADAECLAVRFASMANLFDKERMQITAARPPSTCKGDRAGQLRRAILYYAALEDRNRSAGQALQLYFKAAELETQIALLRTTDDDLAGAIKKSDELLKKGFHLPVDPGGLRRQLLDAESDLTRAQSGLLDVNCRLKELIGATDLLADEWLWPSIEVPVTIEGVNVDGAIQVALQKRPELLLLRELNGNVNGQTLPVIREYLHGANALMGATESSTKHVVATIVLLKELLCGGNGEKESRQSQIAQLLAERERAVADEVRRAVADLHAKARLVALSRERALSAEKQHADAKHKAELANGSFLEEISANLDWYKARNQLTVDVMAWHTARAKVREVQGLFVWECRGLKCGEY